MPPFDSALTPTPPISGGINNVKECVMLAVDSSVIMTASRGTVGGSDDRLYLQTWRAGLNPNAISRLHDFDAGVDASKIAIAPLVNAQGHAQVIIGYRNHNNHLALSLWDVTLSTGAIKKNAATLTHTPTDKPVKISISSGHRDMIFFTAIADQSQNLKLQAWSVIGAFDNLFFNNLMDHKVKKPGSDPIVDAKVKDVFVSVDRTAEPPSPREFGLTSAALDQDNHLWLQTYKVTEIAGEFDYVRRHHFVRAIAYNGLAGCSVAGGRLLTVVGNTPASHNSVAAWDISSDDQITPGPTLSVPASDHFAIAPNGFGFGLSGRNASHMAAVHVFDLNGLQFDGTGMTTIGGTGVAGLSGSAVMTATFDGFNPGPQLSIWS